MIRSNFSAPWRTAWFQHDQPRKKGGPFLAPHLIQKPGPSNRFWMLLVSSLVESRWEPSVDLRPSLSELILLVLWAVNSIFGVQLILKCFFFLGGCCGNCIPFLGCYVAKSHVGYVGLLHWQNYLFLWGCWTSFVLVLLYEAQVWVYQSQPEKTPILSAPHVPRCPGDMPGQGVRITAGLTLAGDQGDLGVEEPFLWWILRSHCFSFCANIWRDFMSDCHIAWCFFFNLGAFPAEDWFQVFVQKVVRRVGMEVMSFFAALLESQLYWGAGRARESARERWNMLEQQGW